MTTPQITITKSHIDKATRGIDRYLCSMVEVCNEAIEIAVAEANAQQPLITAEEARKLGAGAEYYAPDRPNYEWVNCGLLENFPATFYGGEVIKYRAIKPEPVEPTSVSSLAYQQALTDVAEGLIKQKSWLRDYAYAVVQHAANGAVEIALKEQANVTLINDSAVDLVAEQANEPKYKKIEGVDHDPYYEPVEPHAELKAMYEQQVKDGTLDNYVWEYKFHLSKEFVPLDGSVVGRGQLLTYADHEYRCTPKPTCQVCNLDTDEFKTMTPEAAKLLQAELGDTVQWWLGFTNMNEWKTLDFNLTGLYSYKLKAKPPRRAPPPLVWPDLECVHDWVQNLQDAHRTCIYCKKSEPIETLA